MAKELQAKRLLVAEYFEEILFARESPPTVLA
jgi:hypothetical protein